MKPFIKPISSASLCCFDGLVCLAIEHPEASALIALQGAQVLRYQPATTSAPVIWLSPEAEGVAGVPVRGGIPVCWPWFGDLQRNPDAVKQQWSSHRAAESAHGYARTRLWSLERLKESEAGVDLTLALLDDVALSLHIHVGQSLTLRLSMSNTTPDSITLSSALHSYFAVSDIAAVTLRGFEGATCHDALDDWAQRPAPEAFTIGEETDQVFTGIRQSLIIDDSEWQRRLELMSMQSHSAVVWNPWIEKSRRLSQFADAAYRRMVCIETGRLLNDAVELQPGGQAEYGVSIRVHANHSPGDVAPATGDFDC